MTEAMNYSLDPIKTKSEATDNEEGHNKTKLYIFICIGVAVLGLIVWLAIGTASSYSCTSDNDSLKEDIKKRDQTIKNLSEKVEEYDAENKKLKNKNDELTQKNNELQVKVEAVEEENTILKRQVAAKDIVIEDLNADITKLNRKIDEYQRKIEGQQDLIEELQDNADEMYSDTRLVVGILNQELNRNQALQKEIDALALRIKHLDELIGKQNLEITHLKDELRDEKKETAIQWLRATLLEKSEKKKVDIKLVYKGSASECGSEKEFYDKVKTVKPNLFLATERITDYIFGGYTSQDWSETGFKKDENAFTFSGTNKQVCKLVDEDHAINTLRSRDGKHPMITFGNYDITIGSDCIKTAEHFIQPNKSYQCPHVESPKHFYTEEQNPTLSGFEFYHATITPVA